VQCLKVRAKELEACTWLDKGLIIPRGIIEQAKKVIESGEVCITFGVGHFALAVHDSLEFATLRSRPIEMPYPPFAEVINEASYAIQHGERLAGDATSFDRGIIAQATKIAASFGTKAIATFPGDGKRPAVIVFPGVPGAMLIVPPMIVEGAALPAATAALMPSALKRTIAALKAHATRHDKDAKAAKNESARINHQGQAKEIRDRIAELMTASQRALPAPAVEAKPARVAKRETIAPASPKSSANMH
jgi:hypothetical protein